MKKVPQFQGSRAAAGQPIRSWLEWKTEFEQNAKLCELEPQQWYNMAQTLLSSTVRDQWLGIIKDKPYMSNWTAMDQQFSALYAIRDKTAEAEERLLNTLLKKDTEQAWQNYVAAMTKHITDMGAAETSNVSERGKWNIFQGNTNPVPSVHSQIYSHVAQHAEGYKDLPVLAKIAKVMPVITDWLATVAAGRNRQNTGTGGSTAAAGTESNPRPNKRARGQADASQAESTQLYTAIPDQPAKECPDVAYQSNTADKPYAHSLRTLLQAEGKCLVCWSPEHIMYKCPERPAALKAEMDRKEYVPLAALKAVITEQTLQKGKEACTNDSAAHGEPMCMHTGPRVPGEDVAGASEAVASVAEDVALVGGTEQPAKAAAPPQYISSAIIEDRKGPQQYRDDAVGFRQPRLEPCMNASSASGLNQHLLMEGIGKYKLKLTHYTFDPAELSEIATETRQFTRDGFAQDLVYKNPACSTDACWLPEKPFQCGDHRGHHCWLDPPVNMIESTLQSYASAKQYDPSNTSMCILVPVMRRTKWWKKMKGMRRIRHYPRGAELLLSG